MADLVRAKGEARLSMSQSRPARLFAGLLAAAVLAGSSALTRPAPARRGCARPRARLALTASEVGAGRVEAQEEWEPEQDDLDLDILEDHLCILPRDVGDAEVDPALANRQRLFDVLLLTGPFVVPVSAFFLWEKTATLARAFIDIGGKRSWFSVDGGAYEIQILVPTTNGIVVPTLSIALGTLSAQTIGTLRQRQVELHTQINLEACEIAVLRSLLVEGGGSLLPPRQQAKLIGYLSAYVSRILGESVSGVQIARIERAGVADNELGALLAELHRTEVLQGPSRWIGAAEGLVVSLNGHRSKRLSVLASTFPPVHWAVLALSAGSICLAFLMESDQEVLRFLDSFQLRLLWAMLVGTFTAIAALMIDLAEPFRGQFRIDSSTYQLVSMRSELNYLASCLGEAGSEGLQPGAQLSGATARRVQPGSDEGALGR